MIERLTPTVTVTSWRARVEHSRDSDDGSILILALVFLIVTSLTIYTIATWAGNSLVATTKFSQASALDYSTSAAVDMAAQNLRYSYQTTTTNEIVCTPGTGSSVTLNGVAVAVYCSILDNPNSAATRVVTFDACSASETESNCVANPFLQAVVSFDDYSESNVLGCISAADQVTCGTAMSITNWNPTG